MNLGTIFANWKTTLLGIIGAAATQIALGTNWKTALLSAVFAALGIAAKDVNVTGGNVQNAK